MITFVSILFMSFALLFVFHICLITLVVAFIFIIVIIPFFFFLLVIIVVVGLFWSSLMCSYFITASFITIATSSAVFSAAKSLFHSLLIYRHFRHLLLFL